MPRVMESSMGSIPRNKFEYDEIIFDHNSNRYISRSQQKEINQLQDELESKNIKKKQNLKSLIAFYYKR